MQVNDKNASMWNILNGNYSPQKSISDSTSEKNSSSITNTQKTEKTIGIDSLFSQNATNTLESEKIEDTFEVSNTFQNMKKIANDFDGNFANLGNSMLDYGILSNEEKIGFDALYKANPKLDSQTNQNIINNSNLNANYANLLNGVDKKIDMIRYLGNF